MGEDPQSTSTGVTRESETVPSNELEGISLKANPAQPQAGKLLAVGQM